jgi:Fur family ferric uptake transcriptional regulator
MQIAIQSNGQFASALREKGFRATYGRVALLEALAQAGKPLAVDALAAKVAGKLDLTNAYRALEALSEAGLVRRVDLGHRHTHYELAVLAPHHHHFVCEECGVRAPHAL